MCKFRDFQTASWGGGHDSRDWAFSLVHVTDTVFHAIRTGTHS